MNLENERKLFKQAYINLRSGSNIPFPNDVFDEYLRLREEEGYKMVPVELPKESEIKLLENKLFPCLDDIHDMYKAMIGVINE